MNKTKIISGMAVHCHHKILFEYCYNYQERVDYINQHKPENERKVRLERFKMLTEEQVAMLPIKFVGAREKYAEAWKEYAEAREKFVEAWKEHAEANKKRAHAEKTYIEAEKKYKPLLEEAHRKIFGFKEWNGTEMVFK